MEESIGRESGGTGILEAMFTAGAHYGHTRSRRHPSVAAFIFGKKNASEIINLEETKVSLERAEQFLEELGRTRKQLLMVGNKPEARTVLQKEAQRLGMPYVSARWIGGTITNFEEIKKRLAKLEDLRAKRSSGGLDVYTKRERGVIDKEISDLERKFSGLLTLKGLPAALIVVDSRAEEIAVLEALARKIPVVSISSSNCDISKIDYPIVANDSSNASIAFFVGRLADAYERGRGKVGSIGDVEISPEA